jgi:hypothetical protein
MRVAAARKVRQAPEEARASTLRRVRPAPELVALVDPQQDGE